MTTDEKRERSFDNVLAELRACHMHGAYLVMMAQATSARDLREMHETLMPDDCRLSRKDYLVFEAEWQMRRGDATIATVSVPFSNDVRRQLITEARDYVALVRETWQRGRNETVVSYNPVLTRANLIEYYARLITQNRDMDNSPQELGNVRDPKKQSSPDHLFAIACRIGFNTDFIATLDEKYFEVGLENDNYTSGIKVCITIPKHTVTETMTHTLLSRLARYCIGRTSRMNEEEEDNYLLITFSVGDGALKALLSDRDGSSYYQVTPEFVMALNEHLKDRGITIAAQSSFKAAS